MQPMRGTWFRSSASSVMQWVGGLLGSACRTPVWLLGAGMALYRTLTQPRQASSKCATLRAKKANLTNRPTCPIERQAPASSLRSDTPPPHTPHAGSSLFGASDTEFCSHPDLSAVAAESRVRNWHLHDHRGGFVSLPGLSTTCYWIRPGTSHDSRGQWQRDLLPPLSHTNRDG